MSDLANDKEYKAPSVSSPARNRELILNSSWLAKWRRLRRSNPVYFNLTILLISIGGITAFFLPWLLPIIGIALSIAASKILLIGGLVFAGLVGTLHILHTYLQAPSALGEGWRKTGKKRTVAAIFIGAGALMILVPFLLPTLDLFTNFFKETIFNGLSLQYLLAILGGGLILGTTLWHVLDIRKQKNYVIADSARLSALSDSPRTKHTLEKPAHIAENKLGSNPITATAVSTPLVSRVVEPISDSPTQRSPLNFNSNADLSSDDEGPLFDGLPIHTTGPSSPLVAEQAPIFDLQLQAPPTPILSSLVSSSLEPPKAEEQQQHKTVAISPHLTPNAGDKKSTLPDIIHRQLDSTSTPVVSTTSHTSEETVGSLPPSLAMGSHLSTASAKQQVIATSVSLQSPVAANSSSSFFQPTATNDQREQATPPIPAALPTSAAVPVDRAAAITAPNDAWSQVKKICSSLFFSPSILFNYNLPAVSSISASEQNDDSYDISGMPVKNNPSSTDDHLDSDAELKSAPPSPRK